jgi:hypothetical protein
VVKQYISACVIGNFVIAQALLAEGMQGMAPVHGSGVCELPEGASSSVLYEEQVQGNTAYVAWQWEWPEPERVERHEFTLAREDEQWRIADEQLTYVEEVRLTTTIEPLTSTVQTREDSSLPEDVAYIEQRGADGSRTVTRAVRWVDGASVEEWVASEEITRATQPTLIVEGTRPRAEILSDVQKAVESYFAVYAAGEYARVVEMSGEDEFDVQQRDLEAIYEVLAFEIIEVDVDETRQLETVVDEEASTAAGGQWGLPTTVPGYQDQVYGLPVDVVAQVSVFVRYRAFGLDLVTEETVQAVYDIEEGWQIEYWGFLAAAAPGEVLAGTTMDGRATEVRVEGVALMREATLIVLTPLEPDASTLREAGSMNELFAAASDDVGSEAGYLNGATIAEETDLGYVWWEPLHPQARNVTVEVGYGWSPNGWHDALTVPVVR